jgi:hypothetical protein
LVTQGGRFSGYGLYLKDGKPTFTMNLIERPKWQGSDALLPGKHTIVFDWKTDPKGAPIGRGGTGTLSVNGAQVAQRSLPHTQPFIWAWDETFDVGLVGGRLRLSGAVPLHRQSWEDHLRPRRNAYDAGGDQGHDGGAGEKAGSVKRSRAFLRASASSL